MYSLKSKKPKTKDHILDTADTKDVKAVIRTKKEAFAVDMFLYSGLRVSELLHMRRSWLDFKDGFIIIPEKQKCNCVNCKNERKYLERKLKESNNFIVFKKYVGDKNWSKVDVYRFRDEAERKINEIKKDNPSVQCKIDIKKPNEHQLLRLDGYWVPKTEFSVRSTIRIVDEIKDVLIDFFKDHNSVLEVFKARNYFNRVLKRIEKRSGVKLFPHALRGTFATGLAKMDYSPLEMKQICGWSSVDTANYYILLSRRTIKKTYDKKWNSEVI